MLRAVKILILEVPTTQNGQIHSNNSSANRHQVVALGMFGFAYDFLHFDVIRTSQGVKFWCKYARTITVQLKRFFTFTILIKLNFSRMGRPLPLPPLSIFPTILQPAILVKVTLLHGCVSQFLNCTNGTISHKASHILTPSVN